jgi:hypothetical protein
LPPDALVVSTRPTVWLLVGRVAPASWQAPAVVLLIATKSPAVVAPSNTQGACPLTATCALQIVPAPPVTMP